MHFAISSGLISLTLLFAVTCKSYYRSLLRISAICNGMGGKGRGRERGEKKEVMERRDTIKIAPKCSFGIMGTPRAIHF